MSSDLLRQNGVRSQIPFWRIFTFEGVKSASDYIICDSCVSYAGTNWFGDTLLGLHKKPEFSLKGIEKESEAARNFIGFLENPRVCVTPGVSDEILAFINILRKNMELAKAKAGYRRGWAKREDFESLGEYCRLQQDCYDACKESEFFPSQITEYKYLEKIVLGVTAETGAKIPYGRKGNTNNTGSFTDEQLVASALYFITAENKSCSIITRDADIRRILFNTLSYLTHPVNLFHAGIVEATAMNQLGIYCPLETGFYNVYSTIEFSQDDILQIPKEKLAAIRQRINSPSRKIIAH